MATHLVFSLSSFRRRPESRKGVDGMFVHTPAFPGSQCCNNALARHFRLLAGGNVLYTPLDSGLRWNDGRASGWSVARHRSVGMTEGVYRDGNPSCSFFGVIPAQAGIQEGRCRDV